jgi:hypothetical protein
MFSVVIGSAPNEFPLRCGLLGKSRDNGYHGIYECSGSWSGKVLTGAHGFMQIFSEIYLKLFVKAMFNDKWVTSG